MSFLAGPIWEWIKKVLPSTALVGVAIYNYMLRQVDSEQAKHEETKLKKEVLENEIKIKKQNRDLSDTGIILDAILKGGKLRNNKRKTSDNEDN